MKNILNHFAIWNEVAGCFCFISNKKPKKNENKFAYIKNMLYLCAAFAKCTLQNTTN